MYRDKMMKKTGWTVFFLILFLIIRTSPVSAVERLENRKEKHFLWTVQSGTNTVYLLGSIHVLKKDSYPLSETIEKIYGCCGKVVFETDLDGMNDTVSQNRMTKLGLYPAGQTLSKNISEQTYQLLRKKTAAAGLPVERIEQFKPWFAALTITVLEIQRLGFDPELGIDRYFFNRAKHDKREMEFLETNEQQLSLMSGMSRQQQEMFLKETLKELELTEIMASDMVKAWETGDSEKLYFITRTGFDEHPDIYYRFFIQRNKNWVPKIEKLLKQDGDVLIIVGAGHLVGEQSLIELLLKKGYKVEQK